MENLYLHNSFMFVGSSPHTSESSTTLNFSPLPTTCYPSSRYQDTSSQEFCLETFSGFYSNDEYMGSTSPYDDDGC